MSMKKVLEGGLPVTTIGASLAFGGVQPRAYSLMQLARFTNPQNCDRILCGLTRRLNRSWEAKPLTTLMQNTRRYRFAFCLDAGQGFVIS